MRTRSSPRRPALLWGLLAALLFLSLGGFVGGIGMLLDPTGRALGMHEVLVHLPVASYALPGLFLLVVMGVGPLLLGYGLFTPPGQRAFRWAWAGTLALTAVLGVWLAVQGAMIGFRWPIQYITALNGVVIVLLALQLGHTRRRQEARHARHPRP